MGNKGGKGEKGDKGGKGDKGKAESKGEKKASAPAAGGSEYLFKLLLIGDSGVGKSMAFPVPPLTCSPPPQAPSS